jgi:hypothetical protein
MQVRRLWLVAVVAALVACGSDDDASSSTGAANAAGDGTVPAAPSDAAPGGDGAADSGESSGHRATVVIGDLTYDLRSGGVFWVCGHSDTLISGNYALDAGGEPIQAGIPGVDVQVNFVLLSPDSTDPQVPMISVQDVGAGTQWQAGEVASVPDATIRDITLVDGVATGTATFVDLVPYLAGDPPELVDGTFEIVCDF